VICLRRHVFLILPAIIFSGLQGEPRFSHQLEKNKDCSVDLSEWWAAFLGFLLSRGVIRAPIDFENFDNNSPADIGNLLFLIQSEKSRSPGLDCP
jgi:hypothetical protein